MRSCCSLRASTQDEKLTRVLILFSGRIFCLTSGTVWPIAHIVNFKFIPSSQRILYINTIQVGYNAFLSSMSSKSTDDKKNIE
jgi:hypothetical protein